MYTSNGTPVAAQVCGCGSLPFKHGKVTIDYATYHPIFSKRGVMTVVGSDSVGIDDKDELREIKKHVCAPLDLPETHLFDVSAAHLEPRGSTDDEDDLAEAGKDLANEDERPRRSRSTDRAKFEMCSSCEGPEAHGAIINHNGDYLDSEVRNKQEGIETLDRLVANGHIRMEDKNLVKHQILDSKLPERDTPSAMDSDDEWDLGPIDDADEDTAKFVPCENCGKHGAIFDHNGLEVAKVLSIEEGLATVDRLVAEDRIYEEDADDLKSDINWSNMYETNEEARTSSMGGGIDADLAQLLGAITQSRQQPRRAQ